MCCWHKLRHHHRCCADWAGRWLSSSLAALTENLNSVPSFRVKWLIISYNSSSRGADAPFWSLWVCPMTWNTHTHMLTHTLLHAHMHTHIQAYTHMYTNRKKKFIKERKKLCRESFNIWQDTHGAEQQEKGKKETGKENNNEAVYTQAIWLSCRNFKELKVGFQKVRKPSTAGGYKLIFKLIPFGCMNNKTWMPDYIISNQILKNDVIFSWAAKPWQYQWCEDGVAGMILWSIHTSKATLESSVALSFHVEDSPSAQSSTAQHSTAILFPFTQAARVLIPKLRQHFSVYVCSNFRHITKHWTQPRPPSKADR